MATMDEAPHIDSQCINGAHRHKKNYHPPTLADLDAIQDTEGKATNPTEVFITVGTAS